MTRRYINAVAGSIARLHPTTTRTPLSNTAAMAVSNTKHTQPVNTYDSQDEIFRARYEAAAANGWSCAVM